MLARLREQIEIERDKLHMLVLERGLNGPGVLEKSQELDQLLNFYSREKKPTA